MRWAPKYRCHSPSVVVDRIDALVNALLTEDVSPRALDLLRLANTIAGDDPDNAADFTHFPRNLVPGDNAIIDDLDDEFRFSTGSTQGDGRQTSHWKDNNLTGTLLGVMDPTLASGWYRFIRRIPGLRRLSASHLNRG